jgi:uncharacterized membrane protein
MNFDGIIIGIGAFLIIGVLHPVVIKTEYHAGVRAWPFFLVSGSICIIISLLAASFIVSALLGILGFSLLWSIRELHEQRERVRKGWFPKKPEKAVRKDEENE